MNAAARLGLFAAGLVAVFGVAAAAAGAIAPEGIATGWNTSDRESTMQDHNAHDSSSPATDADASQAGHLGGLSLAEGGFRLATVHAPGVTGEQGPLSFRILDADGDAVTEYDVEHDKELHMIVVRTDGTQFRHVHPERDAEGVWSIDWSWDQGGSYRLFADFAASGSDGVTLTRTVDVAGAFAPVDPQPTAHAQVAGYDVHLTGDLVAGTASDLTVSVTKDGAAVTDLEPYLGAFGHLVALRQGDLGYAHVHPEGTTPAAGDLSGPDVRFAASVPTPGRYLLYFDFQVDDTVHSVPFVVDTVGAAGESDAPASDDHQH
ncbi:heavy-metal-associated domain-containing protein [Microbacterium sp. H1-D42]|uniref:heavy-metal-associated domain-containing protein n=1 Tax=Microbacterium sp. H1-D42 TaxID=2925844 RepID=UPI001F53976A|nr:heavy-metal-associated domain-containing protein [Microbacterium sp. H1-D42]UNK70604.1 heavy-metal-associated domain-containing protein [Microbacterium sp. H1-D42]